jgi:hypothetical protein
VSPNCATAHRSCWPTNSRGGARVPPSEQWGEANADELISYLPPVGWADVATKQDLVLLTAELGGRITAVEAKLSTVDVKLAALDAKVGAKIEAVDEKLGAKIDANVMAFERRWSEGSPDRRAGPSAR